MRKWWLLGALIVVVALLGTAYRVWAVNANPAVGSVWTWLGPTFGADWMANPAAFPSGVDVRQYGAVCNGSTNDTTALQAAINAVQSQAGAANGEVLLPTGTCLFTPPLTISGHIKIRGQGNWQSILKETTGQSANLINVGYQVSQVYGVQLEGFQLWGNAATGGYAISSKNVGNLSVRDIIVRDTWCGIEDQQSNFSIYYNIWGYTQGTNCQAFYWHAAPGVRADQLIMINVAFNSNFKGNDGFVWDGMANTVDMQNVIFLQNKHGFWVRNTAGSTSDFPQFASIYNLQVEGSSIAACEIDAGRSIYFTDSFCHSSYGQTGQGNNDTAAFWIKPDSAGSVTSDIKFQGGSIGLSAAWAALMQAQGVAFSNVSFRASSQKTPNSTPSVEIQGSAGTGSSDYTFANVKFCGVYGDNLTNNYGLIRDAFAGSVRLSNADFNYCQVGEVVDKSAVLDFVSVGGIDRTGYPLPTSAGRWVSNNTPALGPTDCGTSPVTGGNNIVGSVTVGSGTTTACHISYASDPAGANDGLGVVRAVFLQGTTAGAFYYITASTAAGFTFARSDGANMAGQLVVWKASQGTN